MTKLQILRAKWRILIQRIKMIRPWPYIGWYMNGDKVSWWFYKDISPDKSGLFQRNWLGNFWSNFWWFIQSPIRATKVFKIRLQHVGRHKNPS